MSCATHETCLYRFSSFLTIPSLLLKEVYLADPRAKSLSGFGSVVAKFVKAAVTRFLMKKRHFVLTHFIGYTAPLISYFCDRFSGYFWGLSQIGFVVVSFEGEFEKKTWNERFPVVTLPSQTSYNGEWRLRLSKARTSSALRSPCTSLASSKGQNKSLRQRKSKQLKK